MKDATRTANRQIMTFGIVMAINFPIYLLIWHFETPKSFQSLTLRLVATAVCVLLALKDYWPKKLLNLLPLYWYASVTFTLPFFFVFMTLENHAATLWLMNLMSAIFFVLLLFDFLSAIVILMLGSAIAVITFIIRYDNFYFHPGHVTPTGLFVTFLAALVIGGLFSRNRHLIENEKLQTMKLLGSSIAHELRTPLASINSAMKGLKKYLPALFDAYTKAKEANLVTENIRANHFELIKNIPDSVERETNHANTAIDMLLLNVSKHQVDSAKFEKLSMNDCIETALERFPYNSLEQKQLIIWDSKVDFDFYGDKTLMIHVLYNLMKNAFFYIHAEGRGQIFIWTDTNSSYNQLHFKDTAKGIPNDVAHHLFQRFYSKREGGTGVGLAFCKMVTEAFNGHITCKSVYGDFAEFILKFKK